MRKILFLLFIVQAVFGTKNYWKGSSTWATAGNWSTGSAPANGDSVYFTNDSSSGNCTVGASTNTVALFNGSGYTGTITVSNNQILYVMQAANNSYPFIQGGTSINLNGTSAFLILGTTTTGRTLNIDSVIATGTGTVSLFTTTANVSTTYWLKGRLSAPAIRISGSSAASGTTRPIIYTGTQRIDQTATGGAIGIRKNSSGGTNNSSVHYGTSPIYCFNWNDLTVDSDIDSLYMDTCHVHCKLKFHDTVTTIRYCNLDTVDLDSSSNNVTAIWTFNAFRAFPCAGFRDTIMGDSLVANYFEKDSAGDYKMGAKNHRIKGNMKIAGAGGFYGRIASTNLSFTRKSTLTQTSTGALQLDSVNILCDSSFTLANDSTFPVRNISIPDGMSYTGKAGSKLTIRNYQTGGLEGSAGSLDTLKSSSAGTKAKIEFNAIKALSYDVVKDMQAVTNAVYCTTGCVNAMNTQNFYFKDEAPAVYGPTPLAVEGLSLDPATGSTAGGYQVTVAGTGFCSPCSVKVGSGAYAKATYNSSTSLTVASWPAGTAGAKTVTVKNCDAQTGTSTFTYSDAESDTLKVKTSTGGTVSPSGNSIKADGDSTLCIATPSTYYSFWKWVRASTNVTARDTANDSCWAFLNTGSRDSITAYFTPNPPTITINPSDTSVPDYGAATFICAATGLPPLGYRWYKTGAADTIITGATSATYNRTVVYADSGMRVLCKVYTTEACTTSTDTAILTVTCVVQLDSVSPTLGKRSSIFRIRGTHFGATGTAFLNALDLGEPQFRDDTLIIDTVPAAAPRGYYKVIVGRTGTIDTLPLPGFRVLVPQIIVTSPNGGN